MKKTIREAQTAKALNTPFYILSRPAFNALSEGYPSEVVRHAWNDLVTWGKDYGEKHGIEISAEDSSDSPMVLLTPAFESLNNPKLLRLAITGWLKYTKDRLSGERRMTEGKIKHWAAYEKGTKHQRSKFRAWKKYLAETKDLT